MYPKISIVTPSYNQADFLEETIISVLDQNYPNLEYIIIDGGSTDGSVDIIKKYEDKLHYWCSEKDKGMYDAINKGFEKSSGEIMAWLNSDDIYFPWTFRTISTVLKEFSEIDWVASLNPIHIDRKGFIINLPKIRGYSKEAYLDGYYTLFSNAWVPQESTFWRRSNWEKAGGLDHINYKFAGDFYLWSKFYNFSDLCGVVSPLAAFRKHTHQMSKDIELYIKEMNCIFKKSEKSPKWNKTLRYITRYQKFSQLPYIRRFIEKYCGYDARMIIRHVDQNHDAFWLLKEYKFT